jgi:hypothetical protein
MTGVVSFVAFALFIGACAGPRKGAGAGGGPATTTAGTSNGAGAANTATGGSTPSVPPTPTATGTPAAAHNGLIAASSQGAGQSETCDDGKCARGLQCVTYYGFAGAAGPKFASCEIRCDVASGKPACPSGQSCITISDGPGSVCRPPDM